MVVGTLLGKLLPQTQADDGYSQSDSDYDSRYDDGRSRSGRDRRSEYGRSRSGRHGRSSRSGGYRDSRSRRTGRTSSQYYDDDGYSSDARTAITDASAATGRRSRGAVENVGRVGFAVAGASNIWKLWRHQKIGKGTRLLFHLLYEAGFGLPRNHRIAYDKRNGYDGRSRGHGRGQMVTYR